MSEYQEINWRKVRPYLIGGAVLIVAIIIISNSFVILKPTERGVVFKKYSSGLDVEHVHSEGLNIIAPWNDMIKFDIAQKQIEETMDLLANNGLSIIMDVTVRYRPKPDEIGYLYRSLKMDYENNLIRPELRSIARQIVGQYTPEELYSLKRQSIESEIEDATREVLDSNHIELTALMLRSIQLPTTIKESIEQKLAAQQEAEKYDFIVEKEEKEAKRKKIESEGKAIANEILNASLTDKILKEKGISATEALANSPNTKVIIIGNSKDGLPIILGGN